MDSLDYWTLRIMEVCDPGRESASRRGSLKGRNDDRQKTIKKISLSSHENGIRHQEMSVCTVLEQFYENAPPTELEN